MDDQTPGDTGIDEVDRRTQVLEDEAADLDERTQQLGEHIEDAEQKAKERPEGDS
jgi:prefoldin subunit 5